VLLDQVNVNRIFEVTYHAAEPSQAPLLGPGEDGPSLPWEGPSTIDGLKEACRALRWLTAVASAENICWPSVYISRC
jgi:hypothetical protein